ncbi:MAG: 50S ribosomal protein L15 [Herpetosiphonaceae bacterium]|nr:50S ribosomal protein L15 [Herpetosiphonaceae bacterium]
MKLHDLKPAPGSHRDTKRVGRGHGSGRGKTAGKGMGGQTARAGSGPHRAFEGGQNEITRRMPFKRGVGFFNRYSVTYEIFNVGDLAASQVEEITPEVLLQAGLVKNLKKPIKILGDGDVVRPLHVTAHKVSKSAQQKIEAAGGTVTMLPAWEVIRRPRGR